MNTHQNVRRWARHLALATMIAAGVMAVFAAPAHADTPDGDLQVKGTGTVYSQSPVVTQSMAPGGKVTFTFKITNTHGHSYRQFKISANDGPWDDIYSYIVVDNVGVGTYFTPLIRPGGSVTITLRVLSNDIAPLKTHTTTVTLQDPLTNTNIETISAKTVVTKQTGTTKHDLFVKYGSQPYVGGSIPQAISSSALKVGNSASFLLRLQNNGSTPAAIRLAGPFGHCQDFSYLIKQGLKNVTSEVDPFGTYSTGVLAPGARVDLKLTIQYYQPSTCTSSSFGFTAIGPDGSVTQTAHVLAAA